MPNIRRGECQVTAGGKMYTLVFDHNALEFLEEAVKPEAWEKAGARWAKMKFGPQDVTKILMAGMQRNHVTISRLECSDIIAEVGSNTVINTILPAFVKAFDIPEQKTSSNGSAGGNVEAGVGIGTAS